MEVESRIDTSTEEQLQALRRWFTQIESVLVCYSGGIDSALLLVVAHQELGVSAIGMTAISPSLPEEERLAAQQLAQLWGAEHRTVESRELERQGYRDNGPDRCYHCKTELYSIAQARQQDWGLSTIVNGTNLDDLGDYRPGLTAAKEAGVRSPFVELKLTKADVRSLAQSIGLTIWDKPAAACLSSRLPYGVSVTKARLMQVEHLERALHQWGFEHVRVRYHHEVARIEVAAEDIVRLSQPELRDRVVAAGRECGFQYVTLDLAGYRTGSLNELLQGRSLKIVS